jgi:CheY-like chemotaxis protein
MTVFMAAIELLLELDQDSKRRPLLELADQSAHSLHALIDDILDFSRIEAGKIELEEAGFELRQCVGKVVDMFILTAGKKNLRLGVTVDPEVPMLIMGDGARLEQVLINLLGNAVKFTDAGEIHVRVQPRGKMLEFSVTDTGIGIPVEKQDLIFDSFSQADASLTRKYGGTGLGLAICRKLVALMGGQISVQSRSGAGSVFVFTVPLRRGEEVPASAPAILPVEPRGTDTTRILLVEDDPAIQKILTMMLTQQGWQMTIVGSGRSAIEKWSAEEYDIILMDLHMPELNGVEATRLIRDQEGLAKGRRTCIIGLTADIRQEIKEECLTAGMDHLLHKPVMSKDLYSVINSCL